MGLSIALWSPRSGTYVDLRHAPDHEAILYTRIILQHANVRKIPSGRAESLLGFLTRVGLGFCKLGKKSHNVDCAYVCATQLGLRDAIHERNSANYDLRVRQPQSFARLSAKSLGLLR